MKKRIGILLFAALLCLTGCSAQDADSVWECREAGSAYRFKQIYMCGQRTGWALTTDNEVLFTENGTEAFYAVREIEETNPGTDGFVNAAFVNETTAYLTYFLSGSTHLAVEYTVDGGRSWRQTLVDYGSFGDGCDAGSAYISFADEQTGYLLYCSTPGAGSMKKVLLGTTDGGKDFSVIADLSERIAGYPQGIAFGEGKGYIAVSYHGEDAYLYTSADGGATWEEKKAGREKNDINYIDGYPPVFCGEDKSRGLLVLKEVGEDIVYRMYVTEDGGDSWEAAGKLSCASVAGYAYIDENRFFILDGQGILYESVK